MSFSAIQRATGGQMAFPLARVSSKLDASNPLQNPLFSDALHRSTILCRAEQGGFKVNADYSCLAGAVGAGNTTASPSLFTILRCKAPSFRSGISGATTQQF